MPLFRVDKREYSEGEVIECNPTSYYDAENFNEKKRNIEDLLNASRKDPDRIPQRNHSLFVFSEFYDAVKFWILQRNSFIYEVKGCADTAVYFRGDMNITDFMLHTADINLLKMLAQQYWQPIHTYKPCIENQVNKVEVVRKVTSNENQRRQAYQEYVTNNRSIERIGIYKIEIARV